MARVVGKSGILVLATIIGLTLLQFGSVLVYEYEESNINYRVYLDSFNNDGTYISGQITVKITNFNPFEVTASDISVKVLNPHTNVIIYELTDDGSSLKQRGTVDLPIKFNILISSIPEDSVTVNIKAFLKWNGYADWIENSYTIALEY